MRKGEYKYIYYVGHKAELFNIEEDPEEKMNLIEKEDFKYIVKSLEADLRNILDPEEVDMIARNDQVNLLDKVGGVDFVLKRGNYAGTPVGS